MLFAGVDGEDFRVDTRFARALLRESPADGEKRDGGIPWERGGRIAVAGRTKGEIHADKSRDV